MTETTERKIHQGRNVKRFREMLGMKQEALAVELGDDLNQKNVSRLEAKEEIEPELLQQVAKALRVPEQAIKNLDEEQAVNIISSTFNDHAICYAHTYSPNFNPIDKIVQLYDEKIALYERILKDKTEIIEKLEQMLLFKK